MGRGSWPPISRPRSAVNGIAVARSPPSQLETVVGETGTRSTNEDWFEPDPVKRLREATEHCDRPGGGGGGALSCVGRPRSFVTRQKFEIGRRPSKKGQPRDGYPRCLTPTKTGRAAYGRRCYRPATTRGVGAFFAPDGEYTGRALTGRRCGARDLRRISPRRLRGLGASRSSRASATEHPAHRRRGGNKVVTEHGGALGMAEPGEEGHVTFVSGAGRFRDEEDRQVVDYWDMSTLMNAAPACGSKTSCRGYT